MGVLEDSLAYKLIELIKLPLAGKKAKAKLELVIKEQNQKCQVRMLRIFAIDLKIWLYKIRRRAGRNWRKKEEREKKRTSKIKKLHRKGKKKEKHLRKKKIRRERKSEKLRELNLKGNLKLKG